MPVSVIGAGLGRTGTLSLKLALEQLGFGPTHHMIEFFTHPETVPGWERAADGERIDWEKLLAGYRATTDWPSCHFYKELAAKYPQAKVILTLRDAQRWFESTQATIFNFEFLQQQGSLPMASLIDKIIRPTFDGRLNDRDHVIAVYNRHNDEVRRSIAPERLLVYDAAQGWEPLCRFLGAAVPDTPYPRANTTDEFVRRHQ